MNSRMNPIALGRALGQHLLLDLHEVSPALLGDTQEIEIILREAARLAGATPIHAHFHHFGAGMGVTGVLLLRESHISIHTWPEHGYAAVDVFMCGDAQPERATTHIAAALAAGSHSVKRQDRGAVSS
ncbi:adenosylmethionine decarboxylase [Uliginosibacterium sp. H3]|uniref:S-adenosylmethionine decarboxylase proenzyme n=1 Tax=Uliginosibacterium silvisoli TaxID=3114758 RepID=A0ABU6JZQ9_9RHOO|nr:adenosylmethionine decarboxylase [Uliginosibacterium sp. H3]